MKRVEECLEKYYKNMNYNCAEAVFRAALEAWEIEMPEETVKVMAGFGGGMGSGNVCGAVTGGIGALSCRFVQGDGGHTSPELMDRVRLYLRLVREDSGSELCSELKPKYFVPEERCYHTVCRQAALLDRAAAEAVQEGAV